MYRRYLTKGATRVAPSLSSSPSSAPRCDAMIRSSSLAVSPFCSSSAPRGVSLSHQQQHHQRRHFGASKYGHLGKGSGGAGATVRPNSMVHSKGDTIDIGINDEQECREVNELALTAHRTQSYGDAEQMYLRVLAFRRGTYGFDDDRVAQTLYDLGRMFVESKKYSEAEKNLIEACAILEKSFDEGVEASASGLQQKADETEGSGNNNKKIHSQLVNIHAEASQTQSQSGTGTHQVVDAFNKFSRNAVRSVSYADCMCQLALCHKEMRSFKTAEKGFKEGIMIFRRVAYNFKEKSWLPTNAKKKGAPKEPNKHPLASVAHALGDCANLLIAQGNTETAVAFLEDALIIRRWLYANHSKFRMMIAQSLVKLSEAKRALGDISNAEVYIEEGIQLLLLSAGRDHPATAAAFSSKGNCLATLKKYHEARRCYEEAAVTFRSTQGRMSTLLASELLKIGKMQYQLGNLVESGEEFQKCEDILSETVGKEHALFAEVEVAKGALFQQRCLYADAIRCLKNALRIKNRANPDDASLSQLHIRIAECCAASGSEEHAAEIETHLLMAVESIRTEFKQSEMHFSDTHSGGLQSRNAQKSLQAIKLRLTDALDDLGVHYAEKQGNASDAMKAFQEAYRLRLDALSIPCPIAAELKKRKQQHQQKKISGEVEAKNTTTEEKEQEHQPTNTNQAEGHPTIAYSLSNFTLVHRARKAYTECAIAAEAAIGMYERFPPHGDFYNAELAIADVCCTWSHSLLDKTSEQLNNLNKDKNDSSSNSSSSSSRDTAATAAIINNNNTCDAATSAASAAFIRQTMLQDVEQAERLLQRALEFRRKRGEVTAISVADTLVKLSEVQYFLTVIPNDESESSSSFQNSSKSVIADTDSDEKKKNEEQQQKVVLHHKQLAGQYLTEAYTICDRQRKELERTSSSSSSSASSGGSSSNSSSSSEAERQINSLMDNIMQKQKMIFS